MVLANSQDLKKLKILKLKDAKEITSGSVLVEEANMDKQQLISFIKEKFEKLQLEREKTPSLEKRNEPTEPSEDCFIEIESFKIMFIVYTVSFFILI